MTYVVQYSGEVRMRAASEEAALEQALRMAETYAQVTVVGRVPEVVEVREREVAPAPVVTVVSKKKKRGAR